MPLDFEKTNVGEAFSKTRMPLDFEETNVGEAFSKTRICVNLRKQGLRCEQQKAHALFYDGHHIGTLVPDLIVEGKLIVDPKVVSDFNESHIAQMLGYLSITGLHTALLLNFKFVKLGIKRVSNSDYSINSLTADGADERR